jgi:hypothetical protein
VIDLDERLQNSILSSATTGGQHAYSNHYAEVSHAA